MLKQVIIDTAETTYLSRWGVIWGVERRAADFAQGNVTFTGTSGTEIPASTEIQTADGRLYTTDALATIAGGGSVDVAVTAEVAGLAGDVDAATELTMVSPIAGVNTTATVASGGLANGTDEELDADYLERILDRIQSPPDGGSESDYIAWAKEVTGVTRAWISARQYGSGTLAVLFVMDDQALTIIPDNTKIAEVQAYIDDETRRPVTADVTVIAPTAVPLNPHITITPSTTAVRNAIEAELIDLLTRAAEPGATLYLSQINEAISNATGETDHTLTAPVANITYTALQVGTLGTITWA